MKTYRDVYAEKAAWRLENKFIPLAADLVIGENYHALAKTGHGVVKVLAQALVDSEVEWKEKAAQEAAKRRTSA